MKNISKEGIKHLKNHEGWKSKPYLDTANVPTIGIGFTYYASGRKVSMDDRPITPEFGEVLLRHLLNEFEGYVNLYVTSDINQNQFDALVSFVYNLGPDNFSDSTLLKKINKDPNDTSIRNEFSKWKYADGKVSKGLINRRVKEANLYYS